ncbi:MAG TPA: DUF5916 domain-containing protein [Panacibacter sp.]|nr:DUF5916 domain-containing protein [Panacibacter sp.]
MKYIFLSSLVFFCVAQLNAQNIAVENYQQNFQVHIVRTASPLKIDGTLDDTAWANAPVETNFFLKFPNDQEQPKRRTEARVLYDDNFIYVAFTCYDSGKNIIQSLKRDIGHIDNDGVGIVLDPQNQHTTGFIFVVNALNAQSEDQLSPNQDDQPTWSWDNKWFSATKRYPDRWTAEMAIPLKSLRFPSGQTTWGINFLRVDMGNNQYSVWTHVPVNFRIYNLGYTGALLWDKAPQSLGKNNVLVPYTTGGLQQDKENASPLKGTFNAGLDAKLTLTPELNLDLTVNPDFSQVEVDEQVTNLTRYDIFLPEKRAFFLENADIFGEYGIPGFLTPFYSRSIGLDKQGNRIPILAGARLSGNIGSATRIGVMNMQTGAKGDFAAQNYSAVSVNQNVFGRSVLKGYYLDREGFLNDDQKKANPLDAWGRNAGLSFDFVNQDGKWSGWAGYHTSFKPGITEKKNYLSTGFKYDGRNFSNTLDLSSTGANYYTDMGYVQRIENYDAVRDTTIRVGFNHIYDHAELKLFPTKGNILRHTIFLENFIVLNPDNSFNERDHTLDYQIITKRNASFEVTVESDEVNLLYPVAFTDGVPLPAANYHYTQFSGVYNSDSRKQFSYNLTATEGGFYNGKLHTFGGGIILRQRPHLNIALQAEYDLIDLPGEYGNSELLLISPKIEVNFTTLISWTTFLQYNTQQNNFNINSRFQYRFKPMSDLYLVYTDNYFTTPLLQNKNRAIVFKLNYWLNM